MKVVFIVSILSLAVTVVSRAQEYKKFKVGLGYGYGTRSANGRALITLEPAYRISDVLAIGLRIEGVVATDLQTTSANVSYTLNGQYYINNNRFRPFVGAGLGSYTRDAISNSSSKNTETLFIFYPRIGFDVGHFSMSLDYNFVSTSKLYEPYSNTNYEVVNGYLGVRAGFFVGGCKK